MKYYLAAFQKYAVFSGRANRPEYWYFVLFNLVFSFVIGFIGGMVNMTFLGTLYSLAVLIPGLAVAIRRLHDVDKSGWFILIPIYNIVLLATEGTPGTNQYGYDPNQPEGYDEIEQIGSNE